MNCSESFCDTRIWLYTTVLTQSAVDLVECSEYNLSFIVRWFVVSCSCVCIHRELFQRWGHLLEVRTVFLTDCLTPAIDPCIVRTAFNATFLVEYIAAWSNQFTCRLIIAAEAAARWGVPLCIEMSSTKWFRTIWVSWFANRDCNTKKVRDSGSRDPEFIIQKQFFYSFHPVEQLTEWFMWGC